ncbi:hypothetical protein [Thermoactinospora rubra]|uniref:hypothetical protein n=1 Tax=Thermoactinospora rubra TaxID=1088767 RepID=UPI000A119221|nr:hypothetical protein [Thermoactinospora rubra]
MIAALMVAGLTACGQNEFIYVRDREGTTYFKVPSTFTPVESTAIDLFLTGEEPGSAAAQLTRQRVWSTAFDQSDNPSPEHLLSSPDPFVYATVHRLTEEQQAVVSMNRLRDFFLPVTQELRELIQQQAQAYGQQLRFTGFELLIDEPIHLDDGARGVHVRFNYRYEGEVQTYDLTALLDERGSTISALVISCRADCFRARAAEFDRIKDSFKLLRLPG